MLKTTLGFALFVGLVTLVVWIAGGRVSITDAPAQLPAPLAASLTGPR